MAGIRVTRAHTYTEDFFVGVCIDTGRWRNRKRKVHGAGTRRETHCMKYLSVSDGDEGGTYSRQGHRKSGAEGGGSG